MTKEPTPLLVLNTGLFSDDQSVRAAIHETSNGRVDAIDLDPSQMNDKDWDDVLARVLSAAKVVTL